MLSVNVILLKASSHGSGTRPRDCCPFPGPVLRVSWWVSAYPYYEPVYDTYAAERLSYGNLKKIRFNIIFASHPPA
jgi:hypothetical protein